MMSSASAFACSRIEARVSAHAHHRGIVDARWVA